MKALRNPEIFTLVLGLLYSLLGLGISFFYEYLGGAEPCKLCSWQRLCLHGLFFVCLCGLFSNYITYFHFSMSLLLLTFFSLASFHFFIQVGWISDFCDVRTKIQTYDEFMKMLNSSKGCASSAFKLFGIPITILNAISALILSLISIFCRQKNLDRKTYKIERFISSK